MSSTKDNKSGSANGSVAKRVSGSGNVKKSSPIKREASKSTAASKPIAGGTRTFNAPASSTKSTFSGGSVKRDSSGTGSASADSTAKKSNRRKRKKNGVLGGLTRFFVYIICVLGISILLSAICIRVANDMFAFVKGNNEITIEIPEGADTGDISKLLGDNGIVDYPTIFKLYTNFKKGKSTYYIDGYKTGSFELSPSMNYDDLIYTLSKNSATREIVRLTFPEGSTVDEIIDILIKGGIKNTREQYIDVIQNYDFDYRFVEMLDTKNFKNGRKYRLEGYLFPDTYDFYTDASPAAVIDKFLVNFNNKFDTAYYDMANKLERSVDDIIIIASLIEKESRRAEDSGLISSVFHNRLNNSSVYPYLQSDATVQYAFPERKSKITPEDLKYDTPYNTYLYKGLPPSAIANPGLDAIINALYPEKSSYYFFIANSRGETLFAKTLDGHNANIAMIQREAAK